MFTQPKSTPGHQRWKKAAIQSAVALVCANALYLPQAMATPACGPGVTENMTEQCFLTSNSSTLTTVSAGVSISVTSDSAVYYHGDLGSYEGGPLGGLTNSGTISSTASGNGWTVARGVFIGNELLGTLTNTLTGQITASATSTNSDANAIGVDENVWWDNDMQGTLSNGGTISASAAGYYGNAKGIYLANSAASTAILTNTGTIQATATGTDHSHGYAYARGLHVQNAFSGTLTNSGTISGDASGGLNNVAYGVQVGSLGGTIANSGTISGTSSGSGAIAYGLYMTEPSGTINNSGTISGTSSQAGRGYSIYVTNWFSNNTGASTINNEATGILRGALYVGGSDSIVHNAGLIDIPLGGYAYIQGNYNQSATGTLKIAAVSNDSEGGYSYLRANGTATIAGKAVVDVKTVNTLAVGQTLAKVVSVNENTGTLTGNFSSVQDNSAMFNFVSRATEGEGGHIDLEIVRALTAVQAASNTANSPALGAAAVFDNAANTGLASVVTALGQLGTQAEVSDALRQTLPLLTGGGTRASLGTLGSINGVIQARTAASRGLSSGDVFYGDKNVWLKPFGSWADQGDRNGVSGYKASTAGLAMGVDATVSDTVRVGLAGAYAKASIDGKSSAAPQSADVNVYQLIGYGSYSLGADTEINFQVDVGRNTTTGSRTIALTSTTAASSYDSLSTHLGVGIGRSYTLNEKTTVTPSLRADYTRVKDDGYLETGAGALNLDVASRTTEQFIVGLDGKINHQLSPTTSVSANVGVGYDTMNQRAAITAAFAGAPGASFVTYGAETSPWSMRAGVGLVHQLNSSTELTARYDAEFREDFLNQTASVKVRWAF